MNYWRRETLEMAGYQQGKTAKIKSAPYHHHSWTKEEFEAFNCGYNDGLKYNKTVNPKKEPVQ
jgi:hypothetical protein|tara:strand:- start:109 stop:297 length:189 start_codon:yes stop_codon:yes gene_type:complete